MLQNNAVKNLRYESDLRMAQQSSTQSTINTGINEQVRGKYIFYSLNKKHIKMQFIDWKVLERLPLPVATVAHSIRGLNTGLPNAGYEVLLHLPSVHIEQTYELNTSLTAITSENRFVVRSPLDEAIFAASENCAERDRLIWGSARSMQLHLFDRSHQEALVLRKKLALGAWCCQPKQLEIWMPPGHLIGYIIQAPTLLEPKFFIMDDSYNQPLLCLEGDKSVEFACFCQSKETYFKIHSGGDLRASIDRKWSSSKVQYCLNIYFSDANLTAKERALILGAAFLMEYLYFQERF